MTAAPRRRKRKRRVSEARAALVMSFVPAFWKQAKRRGVVKTLREDFVATACLYAAQCTSAAHRNIYNFGVSRAWRWYTREAARMGRPNGSGMSTVRLPTGRRHPISAFGDAQEEALARWRRPDAEEMFFEMLDREETRRGRE